MGGSRSCQLAAPWKLLLWVSALTKAQSSPNLKCQVGDLVHCPGTTVECAGDQCCADGSTCPSASDSYHKCPKGKTEDCTKAPQPQVKLGPECKAYLAKKNFASAEDFQRFVQNIQGSPMPCVENTSAQASWAPDPKPGKVPGATDTSNLACRYGNPTMCTSPGNTCCGLRPHFNWVVSTCENENPNAPSPFCKYMPDCIKSGSPKINYVAAYQFNGNEFELMDESSAGELSADGIAGNYASNTGWEEKKNGYKWHPGDWPTKYAPKTNTDGPGGPRGVTPPAGLWVLSADNFYYGGFYMLSQLGINLEGNGYPTGTNCWNWEFDAVEGTGGWNPEGRLPGSVNTAYSTSNAQVSGCMPISYLASQVNGLNQTFKFPEEFRDYCSANPESTGCHFWDENNIMWSGGNQGSDRFENWWDEPYVFAVVMDQRGMWIYRWRPGAFGGKTGWNGISQYSAARTLPARPKVVEDPRGLATDVAGDVKEAVIHTPGLSPEAACSQASVEPVDWQFGPVALGAMAQELEGSAGGAPDSQFEGAQNWWSHFVDTEQYQGYPLSIAGVPADRIKPSTCDTKATFSCACKRDSQMNTSAAVKAASTEVFV